MLLHLSHFRLNSYAVLVVSKQKGIALVFKTDLLQNDVDINSTFDSIAVIQRFIQRESKVSFSRCSETSYWVPYIGWVKGGSKRKWRHLDKRLPVVAIWHCVRSRSILSYIRACRRRTWPPPVLPSSNFTGRLLIHHGRARFISGVSVTSTTESCIRYLSHFTDSFQSISTSRQEPRSSNTRSCFIIFDCHKDIISDYSLLLSAVSDEAESETEYGTIPAVGGGGTTGEPQRSMKRWSSDQAVRGKNQYLLEEWSSNQAIRGNAYRRWKWGWFVECKKSWLILSPSDHVNKVTLDWPVEFLHFSIRVHNHVTSCLSQLLWVTCHWSVDVLRFWYKYDLVHEIWWGRVMLYMSHWWLKILPNTCFQVMSEKKNKPKA